MRTPLVSRLAAVIAGVGCHACHVVTETAAVRPGTSHHAVRRDAAVARAPTLVIDDDTAALRFVEPLDCPGEDLVDQDEVITRSTRPNIGLVTLGMLITAAGGITTTVGALDGTAALTIAGVAALALGLPLAIGPWLDDRDVDRAGAPHPPLRHATTSEPCGTRPLAATAATLDAIGIEVAGTVDATGAFSVSPFLIVDAFDPRATGALDVRAAATTPAGDRAFHAVIEADALARGARTFLASRVDFDTRVEPLRVVPDLAGAPPQVAVIATADGPAARVALAVHNNGPGDSWQLRGVIETAIRAIDGRVLYFGHIKPGETATRELVIPLTASSASALRNATIELAIQLRDAHGTAPETPVRFRGAVVVE